MKKKIIACTLLCLIGLVATGLGLAMYFNDRSYYLVELMNMNEQYELCEQLENEGADERTLMAAYQAFENDADHVRDSRKNMRQSWILTGPGLAMLFLGGAVVFKSRRNGIAAYGPA